MGNAQGNIHTITEGNNEEEKCEESDSESEEESTDDYNTTLSDDDEYDGFAFMQEDIVCSNQDKVTIQKSWILLDSQSMVDLFSNKKLITTIRESKSVLTLYCNPGKVSMTQKGDLCGYGTVWYYSEGIANILSLYNVQRKHIITFDSIDGTGFTVHEEDGTTRVFKPSKKGLFFSDVKSDVVLINTVDSIKNRYTVKSIPMPGNPGPYRTS
jgi:hypothetical protein